MPRRSGQPRSQAAAPPVRAIASQRIYEGRVLNLRVDSLDVGKGQHVKREIVEHRGAVVIAPVDRDGSLLMVRQYRHPAGERLLELPAGAIDPNEHPKTAAARELQEEIGYAADALEPCGGFYSAPGFCTEYLCFFIARGLRPARLPGDADESIEVERMSLKRALYLILVGEIKDAKTIAGLHLLRLATETR